jgi:Mg2+/Co2+ transporter CorB
VVTEAGALIPQRHRQMLLSILDLERVTRERHHDSAPGNLRHRYLDELGRHPRALRQTPHSRLPVYDGELDNLIGILHMKRVAQELARGTLTRERLTEISPRASPTSCPRARR